MSMHNPMINAILRLEIPDAQKPAGNKVEVSYPASTLSDHSRPPLLHSQRILSSLKESKLGVIRIMWVADLPSSELNNHKNSADEGDDDDEWPQELADPGPYV